MNGGLFSGVTLLLRGERGRLFRHRWKDRGRRILIDRGSQSYPNGPQSDTKGRSLRGKHSLVPWYTKAS